MSEQIKSHGGIIDPRKPEHRAYATSEWSKREIERSIPDRMDIGLNIRDGFIIDQGTLNSCGGCAIARMVLYRLVMWTLPSALAAYYRGREMMGTIDQDSGIQPSAGLWALQKHGLISTRRWPYEASKFREVPPTRERLVRSGPRAIFRIAHQERDHLRACLTDGHPFIFLMEVYASDYDNATGVLDAPAGDVKGMHIVCAEGFTPDGIIFANSWGSGWGNKGRALMPWDRFERTTSACWTGRGWR